MANFWPKTLMIPSRERNRGNDGRLGVVIACKEPHVEVHKRDILVKLLLDVTLSPVIGVQVPFKHLHDARLSAAPIAEDTDGDWQHLTVGHHAADEIRMNLESNE